MTTSRKLGTLVYAMVFAALLFVTGGAFATETITQTVTYAVDAINEISVSGSPGALTVIAATAGSQPNEVSDSTTTYAITTNETSRKITGVLDSAMPTGVTLKINLAAPDGGTNVPDVTLSATAADLVTGISTVAESLKIITYKLSATVAAGVVTSAVKTVTLTIAAQ